MTSFPNKQDFPFFNANPSIAYLDTAATSQTPLVVSEAMERYYREDRASVHRGVYTKSEQTSEMYESVRGQVAQFIGAESPDSIVFTSGATAASNMLVYALENSLDWNEGDEIIVSVMEHHASLIPLQELAKRKGLVLKTVPLRGENRFDVKAYEEVLGDKTRLVSVTLASNVTGVMNDIWEVAKKAHEHGALVISDGTAAVGHVPVDVGVLDIDFLYFSGHKMCGPTGVGVLYGKKELLDSLHPGVFGGGIVSEVNETSSTYVGAPTKFEAGTPNIAGVLGLGVAIEYLQEHGIGVLHAHVAELLAYARESLEEIEGLTVYGEKDAEKNVGILSFTMEGIHPHDIADICGRDEVAVRAGHHCAYPLVKALGVESTVRMSLYGYNTKEDVDQLIGALQKARALFA